MQLKVRVKWQIWHKGKWSAMFYHKILTKSYIFQIAVPYSGIGTVGAIVVSRGQNFFLFVFGTEKKGSGYPSIEILCSRIDRYRRVLMSC